MFNSFVGFVLLLCLLRTRNCGFHLQHCIIQIIEGALKILIGNKNAKVLKRNTSSRFVYL